MKTKSGIKVWYHPEKNEFVLSFHVYGCIELDNTENPFVEMRTFEYIGEAIENSHQMVCIFHEDFLSAFEFIGFL